MKITPNDKQHWLELRLEDVTSTEVSALYDLSPYTTLFELWHRKKNKEVVEFEENERMMWGNFLEPAIAEGIGRMNDWAVSEFKDYVRDKDLRMGSSFDYKFHSKDEHGLLEIKNVDSLVYRDMWKEDEDGNIEAPFHIELQVQHQLALTGLQVAYIGALIGGNHLKLIRREPDKDIIKSIKSKVVEFWETIYSNSPPEPDFINDAQFISQLYGRSNEGEIIDVSDDKHIKDSINKYNRCNIGIKQLEDMKKAAKSEMLTLIGSAEKAYANDFYINAKTNKRGVRSFRIYENEK